MAERLRLGPKLAAWRHEERRRIAAGGVRGGGVIGHRSDAVGEEMEFYWKVVAAIGTAASLIAIGIAVATWTLDIRDRLNTLESRVTLIATAPTISRQDGYFAGDQPASANSASPGQEVDRGGNDGWDRIRNPLIATCIELIKREAAARDKNDISAAVGLSSLQTNYDCRALLRDISKKKISHLPGQ